MDTESPRLRLSILGIVAFSLFAALFARLWYLQIMATDQGEVEAANNRVRTIQEEAPRGRILDAKGRVLVDNRTSLVVTIDPHRLLDLKKDEREALLTRLATELTRAGVPTKVTSIQRRLDDPQYSPLQPIPVAIDVPDELMVFLAERADDFPSVQVRRESVRYYPFGSLAAHVVGYVGVISPADLLARMGTREEPKPNAKPYEPDSAVGKTGVEKTFEDDLRGTPGIRTVEVDRNGKVVRELKDAYKKPVPGSDIQLTIDIDLQRATEAKLADQLESRRGHLSEDGKAIITSPAGSSVVLDPRNGNVIAMASYPTYDPTQFVNGISSEEYKKLTEGDATSNPLTNRAVGGLYSPGSTFKLVTASAALAKGVTSADTWYQDSGTFNLAPGVVLRNAEGRAHGPIQMPRAITVSSDVYFYDLGFRFWIERDKYGDGIQEYAHAFGFGAPTGIDLPGELGGVVPDQAWLKQYWESLPDNARSKDGDKWYAGDNVNLAIGQGYMQATPLQIANAYAAFSQHGDRYKPNLVTRVLSTGTDPTQANPPLCESGADLATAHCLVRAISPLKIGHVDLPSAIYDPLHQGFAGVTTDSEGTATGVFEGFDQGKFGVIGKTGTAQVNNKADTSLFVGVGPSDDPAYAGIAVLEQSGFGATAAAPVVREVFDLVSGQGDYGDPCATPVTGATTTTRAPDPSKVCPDDANGTNGSTTNGTGTTGATTPTYTAPPNTTATVPRATTPTTRATTPTSSPPTSTKPATTLPVTVAPTQPPTTPAPPPTSAAGGSP
jgi:penicillin-binding protein 2